MNAQQTVQRAHFILRKTFERLCLEESQLGRFVLEWTLSTDNRASKRLYMSSPFSREGTRVMVVKLAESGWLVRKQCAKDGRRVEIWPSSKLLKTLEEFND